MLMAFQGIPVPPDESAREAEVLRSGVLFVGPDPRLTAIVERAQAWFGTAMAAMTIIHAKWQHVIAAVGLTPGTYPRSTSFCGYTILNPDRVFCVPDAAADVRLAEHPNVVGGDCVRFYAGSPLISRGVALGALCVFDTTARSCPDAEQEAMLQAMAAEAMATVNLVARTARS